ncbi:MAG: hypothetical protein ACD_8C00134G0001 [uncultured bacterium]|nr:MAG: hypothetical protein ACD_8C00134G0001 [uncultured bacterium]
MAQKSQKMEVKMPDNALRRTLNTIMNEQLPVNVALQPMGNIGGIITRVHFASDKLIEMNGQTINLAQCREITIPLT